MSSQQSYRNDERVYFQVHGLPQVFKLKIAADSPLHHLFDHIPTQKYQPPLCISGPEFVWRDTVLDPNKTPDDYRMDTGERSVQTITVNFPLVSPRSALEAQQLRNIGAGDDSNASHMYERETPRTAERHAAPLNSGRLSIEGDNRRSPLPPSARSAGGDGFTSPVTNSLSGRNVTPPLPSVDKIIDDLTQALRNAEDEIEELQGQVEAKERHIQSLNPQWVAKLEQDNARLQAELDAERKENDLRQESIQILRNKIAALEGAAARAASQQTHEVSTSPVPSLAASALGTSAAAEALVASLRHHCNSLEGEVATRDEDIRQLNQKLEQSARDLGDERAARENEAKLHREALDKLDATKYALNKKDESALNTTDELRMRIDRLERENAIMQADNTTLAQRVVAAEVHKNELRGVRNQYDIDTAAWGAQKNAYDKEIKALREKLAEQMLQSQRHEKVLAERNSALQEKIAFFEDPRSVTQREEEYQQRELEMRSRLRDTLAENDRLKTISKDLKRQVSELETSLFECNNVLVRVQKENTDMKKAGISAAPLSLGVTPRLSASARTPSAAQQYIGSPIASVPASASAAVAASKAADSALLHVDPFSLVKSHSANDRSYSSPNVADALLLSRHTATATPATEMDGGARNSSSVSGFQDA